MADGFYLPWKEGNHSAYIQGDSVAAILRGLIRARTSKDFILRDVALIEDPNILCARCGNPLTIEAGNRGVYHPKTKTVTMYHYNCMWDSTMEMFFQRD
jgi:hypothetical protein